jgi:hypothetical protein
VTPVAPADLLAQVADERQTGALMVTGQPGGAVYVLDGRVIYAESPAAPGVGELLTSSGRLAGRTWQNALDLGTATARVGRLLVEQGHLTQGELELCVLGATYDAAYFALSVSPAPAEFLQGATHWLGAVVQIDPAAVTKEVTRRVRLLADIFGDSRVDTLAVTPAPRAPRERVTLTSLQWELLINADGQRTPADLALLLGRAGYATIQELRRMAAMGLLELPDVRGDGPEFVRLPRARGTSVEATRPVMVNGAPVAGGRAAVPGAGSLASMPPVSVPPVSVPPVSVPPVSVPPVSVPPASAPPAEFPPVAAQPFSAPPGSAPPGSAPPAAFPLMRDDLSPPTTNANGTVYRPPRLARRKPGAKLPKELAAEPPQIHQGTDEVLLKRIRTALRGLR